MATRRVFYFCPYCGKRYESTFYSSGQRHMRCTQPFCRKPFLLNVP